MNFGSKYAWIPKNSNDEEEEIFEDDINDGLEKTALRDEEEQQSDLKFFNNNGPVNQPPQLIPQQNQQQYQQNQQQNIFQNNFQRPIGRKTQEKKKVKTATTNVIGLDLGKLGEAAIVSTGDPIYCKCQSMFNNKSELTSKNQNNNNNNNNNEEENNEKIWKCEFCGEENMVTIHSEEIPKEDTVDYLLEPAMEQQENQGEANTVIFVVDTSGSMCVTKEVEGKISLKGGAKNEDMQIHTEGEQQWMPRQNRNVTYISRLQCVQASVEKQIETFVKENPNKKIGLVSFNSQVEVIGDGMSQVVTIGGDKLSNFESLLEEGKKLSVKNNIKTTHKSLVEKLYKLQESGTTALGPALVVALGIASESHGNTIVLLTDGLANVGIGSMEDLYTEEQQSVAESFYRKVGEMAQLNGTTISITSIEGSECKMENLGLVAELSNGEVDIVDPLQLTNNFANILSKTIVATECNLIFKVHKGLVLQDDQSESEQGSSTLAKSIGNVSNDLTVTFEYTIRSMKELKELNFDNLKHLPFQVQIIYRDLSGAKKVRCITKNQVVTSDKEAAEKEIDISVVSANTVQQCGKLAAKGMYKESRVKMVTNQKMMSRNRNVNNQEAAYSSYVGYASKLDNALLETEEEELQQGQNTTRSARKQNRKDKVSNAIYQAKKHK